MKLCLESLGNVEKWEKCGVKLPSFDIEKMRKETEKNCTWIHFGAGNIFRCFPAARMQELLEKGIEKRTAPGSTTEQETSSAAFLQPECRSCWRRG